MTTYLKTHLHILQLEGYSPRRFLNWWLHHPFTYKLTQKMPLVMTPKALLLLRLTYIVYLVIMVIALTIPHLFILLVVCFFIPFPLLFLSLL